MEESNIENTMEPTDNEPKKRNKTEDRTKYMREYMRQHYSDNKDRVRRYKNSQNMKAKYNIDEEISSKYGVYLYNIVKIKQLKDDLPTHLWESFLLDYHKLEF